MTRAYFTRTVLVSAAVTISVLGALAAAAQASYFNPKGLYDCLGPQATYADSYQFKSNHRYALGIDQNGHLAGHIASGHYKLSGKKIIGLSGPLKKHHESLLIQRSDLALLIAGHFTSIGCRLHRHSPPTTTTTTPTSTPPGSTSTPVPLGTYSCYATSEISGAYYSTYKPSVQLFSDGTYMIGYSPRYPSAWHQSGDSIVFTEGAFWNSGEHDVGTYYPGGVSMPSAQSNVPGSGYTLVIKDTVAEGGDPPSQEFSTTDGPGGAHSAPVSFWYCRK